jgi:hypothetical protein
MHSVKHDKIQLTITVHSFTCHPQAACPVQTKDHKFNTPFQALNAVTLIIKINGNRTPEDGTPVPKHVGV